MRNLMRISIDVAGLCMAFTAMAQKPVVYPAKGQSAQQQGRDDGECYAWSRQNTGIDPARLAPPAQATGPATGGGERVQGAARGAVGGLAFGAIAGDAGQGAAIGAVVGTMAGGRQARQNQQAQNQQAQAAGQWHCRDGHRAGGAVGAVKGRLGVRAVRLLHFT